LHDDLTRVYDDLCTSLLRAQSAASGLDGKVVVGRLTHCDDAEFSCFGDPLAGSSSHLLACSSSATRNARSSDISITNRVLLMSLAQQ